MLLKSEVCGSREQCTGPTGVHYSHGKINNHDSKKKKKTQSRLISAESKCHLNVI